MFISVFHTKLYRHIVQSMHIFVAIYRLLLPPHYHRQSVFDPFAQQNKWYSQSDVYVFRMLDVDCVYTTRVSLTFDRQNLCAFNHFFYFVFFRILLFNFSYLVDDYAVLREVEWAKAKAIETDTERTNLKSFFVCLCILK